MISKYLFYARVYRSNKIEHRFHVVNNKYKLRIGYDVIIGRDLIVQLDLTENFKRQVLWWDGETVPMKQPSGMLEK